LTAYDRRSDAEVAATECPKTPSLPADIVASIQREPTWNDWVNALRRFQQLNREKTYAVAFFANAAPRTCDQEDVFMDGGSAALNHFYMNILSAGTPAVSAYDAFRPLRPSQMPDASGHSLGNANLVKADALFGFLRETVFPSHLPDRASSILHARAQ
jgi:hypothetical protein